MEDLLFSEEKRDEGYGEEGEAWDLGLAHLGAFLVAHQSSEQGERLRPGHRMWAPGVRVEVWGGRHRASCRGLNSI